MEELGRLADQRITPRAEAHDRNGGFPREDFDDLRAAGFHRATVPTEFGGLGLGVQNGASLTHWLMTKVIAGANLSLARCWEAHTNICLVVAGLAEPALKQRLFHEVVEEGALLGSWASEPPTPAEADAAAFGLRAREVPGGYVLNGRKGFCSGAGGIRYALLLASTGEPPARNGPPALIPSQGITLIADVRQPGVTLEPEWWTPIGMKASVSHAVRFEDVFVPREQQLGTGVYYTDGSWLPAQLGHMGCSFLGAAETAYGWSLDYLKQQGKSADPFVQRRVGEMEAALGSANLWVAYAAARWDRGDNREAARASMIVRYQAETAAAEVLKQTPLACGARSFFGAYPFERIYRDLSLYIRQMNQDRLVAGVGAPLLGVESPAPAG